MSKDIFFTSDPVVNPLTTTGDTIYSSSGSVQARLPIGSSGQIYQVSGAGIPSWSFTIPSAASQIQLTTGNGYGSTNTKCKRFLTTNQSIGSDITCNNGVDDATKGSVFTIVTAGVYTVSYTDSEAAAQCYIGIVVNGTALTTAIATSGPAVLTYAQGVRAVVRQGGTGQTPVQVSWTGRLAVNDLIYAQSDAGPDSGSIFSSFVITRVA